MTSITLILFGKRFFDVLAATGLYGRQGRFHEFPIESLEPLAEKRQRLVGVLNRNPRSG